MTDSIIVALISGAITLIGIFISAKGTTDKMTQKLEVHQAVTENKIDTLQKQVEKHNSIIERTFVLERDVKTAFNRIDEIRNDVKELEREVK